MTVFNATTAAEIHGHFNGTGGHDRAGNGDTILMAAGDFDVDVLALGDLDPQAGVAAKGAGKALTKVHAGLAADPDDYLNMILFEDWTLDVLNLAKAGVTACCEIMDALFWAVRWGVVGPGAAGTKTLEFRAATNRCLARMDNSEVDGAATDCISTGGANDEHAAASLLTLNDCEAHHSGNNGTDQPLTAHGGFALVDNRGHFHDSPDFSSVWPAATDVTLRDTVVEGGTAGPTDADGVTVTTGGEAGHAYGVRLPQAGSTIVNSTITGDGGAAQWYGVFVESADCVVSCVVTGWKRGIRPTAAGAVTLRDCKVHDNFNYGLWYYNVTLAHVLNLEGRNEFVDNTTADMAFSFNGGTITVNFGSSDLLTSVFDGALLTVTGKGGRMIAGTMQNVTLPAGDRLIKWGLRGTGNNKYVEDAPRELGGMMPLAA